MNPIWRDIRFAVRALSRSPGFVLTVVVSVGLGVGANTTVFAWMDNIVRNPFPAIPDGGALVALNVSDGAGRVDGMPPIAYLTLDEWTARLTAFEAVAAHSPTRLNLRLTPTALGEPVWTELVSANFFDALRVGAAAGRVFDETDRASQAAVVVLSHRFWRLRFGGAADVLGRSLIFNGTPVTVIGVAPPRFDGAIVGLAFDAWVPIWLQASLMNGTDWLRDRKARRLQAVGRLRPGGTLPQANRELLAVARDVSRSYGEVPVTGGAARWVSDTQLGSLMGPLSGAMLALTLVVLLTTSANVAGLQLARAADRRYQTAIQMAMGASRRRLVTEALVQSVLLAAVGCVAGLIVAEATKGLLTAFIPRIALPVSLEIDLNGRVVAVAVASSACAALLFGLLPALRAPRADVSEVLKRSAPPSGVSRRFRLREALVVGQIACSMLSLSTAGLFLRSAWTARHAPLGFADPSHVLLISTDLSFTRVQGGTLATLVERALERVRALPGVRHASLASIVPLGFGGPPAVGTRVDGYVPAADESMLIDRAVVSGGYFETMGIPLVGGRGIADTDRAGARRVVVVNEAFVARFWPGQSGIGRRVDQGDGWAVVAGVARNSAVDSLTEAPRPLVYHAFGQTLPGSVTLHVRSGADPLTLVQPVRRELALVHPDLPALDPGTLANHMAAATFVQSVGSTVFVAFGLIALFIAATGVYGMLASHVAGRGHEVAVMRALGAATTTIARDVAGPALRLTAVGLAVGAAIAVPVASLVKNRVTGVSLVEPAILSCTAAVLIVVVLATCAWPIRRAVRSDPASALRVQ